MRALVSVAVLVAFCASTSLVADDMAVAEHDVKTFLSNLGNSFESRDAESIKKMVSDKELLESLLEQMLYDKRRPLYFRLEFDSILMKAPFIVRARLFRRKDMYPNNPVLVDVLLEKRDGKNLIAGHWSRQMEELDLFFGRAVSQARQMANCVNSGDENAVLQLFGAGPGLYREKDSRRFLINKGVGWIDDAIRTKCHIQGEQCIPTPVDVSDPCRGMIVFFQVLNLDGTDAGTHWLLFKDAYFVGKFVPPGNVPRTTTSFEYEKRTDVEAGVRKYMSDLVRAVGSRDSSAVVKMIKDVKILRGWLGEIEKGRATDLRLEYDSLVSLSPLVARAKMRSGEGQGASESLLVEMQLERTGDQYEIVNIAARQSDEEMLKAYRTANASSRTSPLPTAPFAPAARVTLEDDARNFVSMFCSSLRSRDVEAVKRLVAGEKMLRLTITEMARIKIRLHKIEFESILSLSPLVVRARFYESAKSRVPILVEMQLERTDGGYAVVKSWSDQLEKQNLAVERAALESGKLVLYVNRCETNSVVQLFGVEGGNGRNFKFREFLKKRGAEWIDDVMRENRRIEGGWVNVLRDKGEVGGMSVGFRELNPDKTVKCNHELLYKGARFVEERTPKPVAVDSK